VCVCAVSVVIARDMAVRTPRVARSVGIASIVMSVIGIVVGSIIFITVFVYNYLDRRGGYRGYIGWWT